MEVKLALGAAVDIASGAELDSGFSRILDELGKDTRVKPTYLTVPASAPIAGTSQFVNVGNPPTGRLWNVLGFTILGQNETVQSGAGTVAFYIGSLPTVGTVAPLSDLRQARMSIPFTVTYSQRTQWCASEQSVFFSLAGITVVTSFVANVWVAEYREDEILERSGRA